MNTFVVHPEEGGPHPLVLWSGSSTCSGEPSIGNGGLHAGVQGSVLQARRGCVSSMGLIDN
jgi:hypothetical protein